MTGGAKKRCSVCKCIKNLREFSTDKRTMSGKRCYCRLCSRVLHKKYYEKNKERLKGITRQRIYKISNEQYNKILLEQNGVCSICGFPETATISKTDKRIKDLAVDHCHKTGKVRGLLCRRCNKGIGLFQEDIDLLASATSYLENTKLELRSIA